MEILLFAYLFIVWLIFWSFASVVIFRLKSWKKWTLFWRSECPHCLKKLWILQLFPLFSYIFYKWKCFNCSKKISIIYPILELCTWLLFASCLFLVDISLIISLDFFEIIKLIFFLIFSFITVVFTFYDILYMEIPESVLIFWNIVAILYVWLFSSLYTAIFLTFLTILFYIILLFELENKYDILILFWGISLSFLLYFLWVNIDFSYILAIFIWFIFFYAQILFSWWERLWWWDLRIVIFMALILWKFMLFWLFFSYFIWSIISIFILLYAKIKSKNMRNIAVPFGPFLAIWTYITLFLFYYLENNCYSCQIFFL